MVEHSAMCDKILRKLELILSSDPGIQEFAIIATPENEENKSPILCEENCIGLESWCEKYLLQYTHTILLNNRKKLLRNQLSLEKMKNFNHILIGASFLQPNVTTFWNIKRELIKREVLNIEQELYFSKIALSRHSKCNEIFSYRKWLIDKIINEENHANILQSELEICQSTAEKSKNNYHAWNHRIWCLEKLINSEEILLSESNFSIDWITKHISENTGYHYRQILIKKLNNLNRDQLKNCINFNKIFNFLKIPIFTDDPFEILHSLMGKSTKHCSILETSSKCVNTLSLLLNDLTYFSTELHFYADHECLWNYRKYLIIHIMEVLYNFHGVPFKYRISIKNENIARFNTNILNTNWNPVLNDDDEISKKITTTDLYNVVFKNENNIIESNKNASNIEQKNLATRQMKWLENVCFHT